MYTTRMRSRFALSIFAASLIFFAAGCYYTMDEGGGGGGGAEPASGAAAPISTLCPGGSFEGCFSYDQMSTFLDAVTPMVAQFFGEEFPNVPDPEGIVYVPSGQAGRSPCGNVVDSQAYEFCGANDTIYIGQDLLWTFYKRVGDAAPVVGLAHEWGHHLQIMRRLRQPQTAVESVNFENQADCVSGAWAKYASDQGWLEPDDDLADIEAMLQAIGSREAVNRDHGTVAERRRAFEMGFDRGVTSCNSFVPGPPYLN